MKDARLAISALPLAAALALGPGCSSVEQEPGDSGATSDASSSTTASGFGISTGGAASAASAGGYGGASGGAGGQGGAGGGAASTGGAGGGVPDFDGDGWTVADGDCCDTPVDCNEPAKVNPGAMEVLGNLVDDDCDPLTQDGGPPPDCSGLPLDLPTTSLELVKAMDLCQFTSENPPLPQKKWGVISAATLLADGKQNPAPDDVQAGVLAGYGPNVLPKKNATLAAISSGTARALADSGSVLPQPGYDAAAQSGAPPVWLAANGGTPPVPSGCPGPCTALDCATAYDSFDLKLRIRVPTNALSFSYDFKFYTAEFPDWLCQTQSDFFVALLDSQVLAIPADHNIAVDLAGDAMGVNSGFLDVCLAPPSSPPGTCPLGPLELEGTGMGGATPWLTNDAPVVPGETMELELVVWDAGGHGVDSLVLLDHFRFETTPAQVGIHP